METNCENCKNETISSKQLISPAKISENKNFISENYLKSLNGLYQCFSLSILLIPFSFCCYVNGFKSYYRYYRYDILSFFQKIYFILKFLVLKLNFIINICQNVLHKNGQTQKQNNNRHNRFVLSIVSLLAASLFILLVCSTFDSAEGGCHKKKIIYKKIKIKLPFLATKKVKVIEKFKLPFQVLVAVPFYFKFPVKVRCGKKKKKLYIKMDFHTKHKKKHDDHDDDHKKEYHDDPHDDSHNHHHDYHHKHDHVLHHDEPGDEYDYPRNHGDYEDNGEDDMPEGLDGNMDNDNTGPEDHVAPIENDDDDDEKGNESSPTASTISSKDSMGKNLLALDSSNDDDDEEPGAEPSDEDDIPGEEHVEVDSEANEQNVKKVSYGNTEEVKEKGFADDDEDEIDDGDLLKKKKKRRKRGVKDKTNKKRSKNPSRVKKKRINRRSFKKQKKKSFLEMTRLISINKIPKLLISSGYLMLNDWWNFQWIERSLHIVGSVFNVNLQKLF